MHGHTDEASQRGWGAVDTNPPFFHSSSSRWHTCTGRPRVGGGGGCNGSTFANTAAFQTDVCVHAHTHYIHKAVISKPIISHLFSDVKANWILGWPSASGGVVCHTCSTHTCTHTHSFLPPTHSHPIALPPQTILSSFPFFLLFLINWCCLRYYLCYTNQINGRHSFLKGKLLKKCVAEQNCGFEEDLRSSASLLRFVFFKYVGLFLFLEVCLILRPWYSELCLDETMFIIFTIWILVSFYRDHDTSWCQTLDSHVVEQKSI